jgi:hypothetical protein
MGCEVGRAVIVRGVTGLVCAATEQDMEMRVDCSRCIV